MATIGAKVEKAFTQLITNLAISGLNAYAGISNSDMEAPAAITAAVNATEEGFPGSGVWHVTTRVIVLQAAADTTADNADGVAGQVFQACDEADLAALGALAGISILDLQPINSEQNTTGDFWEQVMTFDVIAALGPAT